MPNSEHGFSPFELICGSRSRTPLEALYFGLNEFNGRNLKTGAWVNDLADKLQLIRNKEENGIISRSNSKWCSPMVPVRILDGSIRICGDFRELNSITTTEPYCIPRLEELISTVGDSAVLSKIDLAKGFHKVSVNNEDSDKLTIITPFGKLKYLKVPFGVASAPATFQKLMDLVLKNCTEISAN